MNKPLQLDFDLFWSDHRPTSVPKPAADHSAFEQRLADAGLVLSPHGNGLVWNPLGLDHPSRMLKFPLHVRGSWLFLVHPALADEPFVDEVERRLGERPVYDDSIAGFRRQFEHHHALDLCRRDRYHLLLDSLHLTTKRAVVEAVGAELRGSCEPKSAITPAIAREILTALGVPETGQADDDILLEAVDIRWRVPMDAEPRERDLLPQENAWDCVHAYERGLVRRDRDGRAVAVKMAVAA